MTTRAVTDIRGLRVGIVGMARSGVASAKLVARHGGSPFVSDAGNADRLATSVDDLKLVGIPFETGGHTDRVLDADFIVVSPGVPLRVPIIVAARERSVPVYSEIELAWWFCDASVIAVTGSNGKTTTTSLVGNMLASAGIEAAVCGNIGLPFAGVADAVPASGVAVVEVSSFQLETVDRFEPDVALILNLQPDHLDRHGSFDSYVGAKLRIAENQTADDVLITNRDDAVLQAATERARATQRRFSNTAQTDADAFVDHEWLHVSTVADPGHGDRNAGRRTKAVIRATDILLPGQHNLANAAAACLACEAVGAPIAAMASALRTFRGVEHRIELVAEHNGVRYVNDSKATNVDATCVAMQAMDRPTVLILGGRHKGSPYTSILDAGDGRLKAVVALGESSQLVVSDLSSHTDVQVADDLPEAVLLATHIAAHGDVVLLSPACASFDMFDDYEQRGRVFKEAVARIQGTSSMKAEEA